MLKSRVRVTSCFLWVVLTFLGFYSAPVKAQNPIITEPTDIWFDYAEPTQFIAQTYMVENYPSDPMLWLYNEQGVQLAANDDSYGLQSYISIAVPAGRYRLRAGICCGDPNAWRTNGGWNLQYELGFNGVGSMQTTTTEEQTTTTTSSTTTTSTTTSTSTTTTTTTTTTSTTVLPTTTSTTSTTVAPTTTTSVASTTTSTVPAVVVATTTTTSSTSTTSTTVPTTTTLAPITPELPQVDPEVTALLGAISMLPQSEVQAAVENIIEEGVSSEEATALATNPDVLESVTADQATEIFDAVDVSSLTDDQADQLVDAVSGASDEVKASFEEEINIFEGKFDKYVPRGSTINVMQRKIIFAATGVLFMAPVVPVSSSTSGSQSSTSSRKQ